MKHLIFICLSVVFIFSGCSNKEATISKYYPDYAKDDILLAGKYAFLVDKNHEYVIDSYRDHLEVTEIDLVFNTLVHNDYMLKVEEDDCGTLATVTFKSSLGIDKVSKYSSLEYKNLQNNHIRFLEKIEFFINKNNRKFVFLDISKKEAYKNLIVEPTKDMSACVIKDEFENSLMHDNAKNRFGDCHENN